MAIRVLYPPSTMPVSPLPAVAAEARPSGDGPWVLSNMVGTIDGATALGGVSGPLGGPADRVVFRAIRAVADAIVVGASTVNGERYQPPRPDEEVLEVRRRAGRSPLAEIVVVTGSLGLDADLPLFADPSYRPLIVTTRSAPADRKRALGAVAEILEIGDERVDLRATIDALGRRGHHTILTEGGPSLNGQLIAADLVDEWNLTISPILAAGDSARPAHGPSPADPARFDLARLWLGDDLLFGRWVRRGAVQPPAS